MAKIEEITKAHQGKPVWLRGTWNNAARNGITPLQTAMVKRVNSKSVVLDFNGREERVTHDGYSIGDSNAGYNIFTTEEAAIVNRQANVAQGKIYKQLQYGDLPDETVLAVADMLGIERSPEPTVKQ